MTLNSRRFIELKTLKSTRIRMNSLQIPAEQGSQSAETGSQQFESTASLPSQKILRSPIDAQNPQYPGGLARDL